MSALIVRGRIEPLSEVPFHDEGPLTRWLMASKALHPQFGMYVAVHEFRDVEPAARAYCTPHVHDHDELNIFHSATGLTVELLLGEETVTVEAPATILIPAGTPHSANVRSGSGTMTAILFAGEYQARAV